ncbi:MAG TPA: trypsin-like peptidase domain-containing protein, partial [Candidatus Subteraquimicrobiales bacterium]
VGRDPETDLAVVKINKKDLPAAELGSSSDLRVGELVVAIGSPFGFEHTVTVGVVSALNRNVTIPGEDQVQTYTDLIQTDAAINPGNSGGALTNASGQVIGVPSLIFSASGGSQGVGFAIPINLAKDVAEQLIKTGEAVHPYIGIVGTTVDKDVAKQFNLSVEEGAMINRIASNTPADKAGMKAGDVVTTFDGKPIKTMDDLIAAIRAKKVDDKVKLTFVRGKDKKEVELTLAEKPRVLSP